MSGGWRERRTTPGASNEFSEFLTHEVAEYCALILSERLVQHNVESIRTRSTREPSEALTCVRPIGDQCPTWRTQAFHPPGLPRSQGAPLHILEERDALRDRAFGNQQCSGDLGSRETTDRSQGQRDLRRGGDRRVAAKHEESAPIIHSSPNRRRRRPRRAHSVTDRPSLRRRRFRAGVRNRGRCGPLTLVNRCRVALQATWGLSSGRRRGGSSRRDPSQCWRRRV